MMWILVGIFGILSAVLLLGKGSFLIAGYNTASEEEKKKYKEKRLCRVIGLYMGGVTLLLALGAVLGEQAPDWYLVLAFVYLSIGTIVVILLCNTICVVKPPEEEKTGMESGKQQRMVKIINRCSVIFTLLLVVVIGISLVTGDVKTRFAGEKMKIVASYWPDYEIKREDIQKISHTNKLQPGKRTNGLGSMKLLEGHFRNEIYGDYMLFVYKDCKSYIVLETTGPTIVLNGETKEDKERLYEDMQKWAERGTET